MSEAAKNIEKKYQAQNLVIEHDRDEPGKIYEPHRHEKTILYTVDGSLNIRLDEGDWQNLQPGSEFVVGSNQLHEAVVGPEGWEYVAAWDPEEAKKYEH